MAWQSKNTKKRRKIILIVQNPHYTSYTNKKLRHIFLFTKMKKNGTIYNSTVIHTGHQHKYQVLRLAQTGNSNGKKRQQIKL